MIDELVGPNDVTSTREILLDNGNKLLLRRQDPYGFFSFSLSRGNLPEWMLGSFTNLRDAEKAVQQYLAYRDFEKQKLDLQSAKSDPPKKQEK